MAAVSSILAKPRRCASRPRVRPLLDTAGAALAWCAARFPRRDEMDWYLIGRILGVMFWPGLVAVALFGVGWAVSLPRPEHVAANIKRWFRMAAVAGFMGTLFFVGLDFLKYTGVFS